MRRSSLYTWSTSRSNAAWSPPLQAYKKPVISSDRVGTVAVLQKKIPRLWPVFPSASACSGGGGNGDENHGRYRDCGGGLDQCTGERGAGGRTAGNNLHDPHRGYGFAEPGQKSCFRHPG